MKEVGPSDMANPLETPVEELIESLTNLWLETTPAIQLPYRLGRTSIEHYNQILGMRLPLHVKLHYNNGTVEIIELPSVPRERAGCEIERQLTYATADNGGGEGDIVSFGTPDVPSSVQGNTGLRPDGSWGRRENPPSAQVPATNRYELVLVLEVGYSQGLGNLQAKAQRWLDETTVKIVILININASTTPTTLTAEVWEKHRHHNPSQSVNFTNVIQPGTHLIQISLVKLYDGPIWHTSGYLANRFPGQGMVFSVILGLSFLFMSLCVWTRFRRRRAVAFLHPYCEMGGGGEVVLWKAVDAIAKEIRKKNEKTPIYIYTTVMDPTTLEETKKSINERFGFDLNAEENSNVKFVHMWSRTLLESKWYPRFTLFGQFLGGVIVSLECLLRLNPALLIESTGIPGALPVFRLLGGSKILVYMHYPTITANMIQRVNRREEMYNNAAFIAKNPLLSTLKCYYYMAFAFVYSLCGRCASKILVNGTFTKQHIEKLWPTTDVSLCYPPVTLDKFSNLKSRAEHIFEQLNEINILSLGQFRPEKNHFCQLETLQMLKKQSSGVKFRLNMLGGIRNEDDQKIVTELRQYGDQLGLVEGEDFSVVCNASMKRLMDILTDSMFGIHTMIDEHFGIALVEMMVAGIIVVAHKSGGPLFDIIGNDEDAGFLGVHAQDYADIILDLTGRVKKHREAVRLAASKRINRFSEQCFKEEIVDEMLKLLMPGC